MILFKQSFIESGISLLEGVAAKLNTCGVIRCVFNSEKLDEDDDNPKVFIVQLTRELSRIYPEIDYLFSTTIELRGPGFGSDWEYIVTGDGYAKH